jgi:ATP-dependent DNA helicase RecQ
MTDEASLTDLLQRYFGFEQFRPGQREVIENLHAGHSAAAVFPTGGGKSLCYQLPALVLPGVTLVVSPLIALMKDQIDALVARGIAAQRLDSTLSAEAYREVMQSVRNGQLRLLYVAPERFNNERFRHAIMQIRVSLFAVDEAHCISEWGHNFRPDYLKLAEFAKLCRAERVLALTATATTRVLDDVCRVFDIAPECATRTGFYRPNLTLLTHPVEAAQRDEVLLGQMQQRPAGPTIVYVTLQRTAEVVADRLAATGLPARPYHAGLSADRRAAVQDWFIQSDDGIVVATIAFGMGVDKANIRYIYHYNLPKSLENYAQEIGRAGRDGNPSICQMLVCLDDMNVLENFVYGDTPTLPAIQSLLAELFAFDDVFDVSYYELSAQHDIRILVVRTLLTYLELDGFLEGGTPFYAGYQFKPILSSKQILDQFEGDRQTFLANLFRQARKARTWLHIDVDQAALALGATRDRVVRALDYLGERQMLEVKAQGVRHRYRRLQTPHDPVRLAASLHQRMRDREAGEIARLHEVVSLAGNDGCQVSALSAHFDRALDAPCGHCSWCLNGQTPVLLPPRARQRVDEAIWHQLVSLTADHAAILSEPDAQARFLCGVTSPKLTRAKLSSHPLFGALAHVPFQEVRARADQLKERP